MKKNRTTFFLTLTAILFAVGLTGCQPKTTTSTETVINQAETPVDSTETDVNASPEPTMPSQDVSKSNDLNTIETELQNTTIVEEDFSDL